MHRDELAWQFAQAIRLCGEVSDKLAIIAAMIANLPEELDYHDYEQLKPQTYAVELQQLLQYDLKSDISYLKKRTEELANEHGSN